MYWMTIAIGGGVLHWLYRKGKRALGPQPAEAPPDPVRDALAGEDIDQLRAVVDLAEEPVAQHLVLSKIIDLAYRERADAAMREILLENGQRYISLFPQLLPALQAELGENVRTIPVFKQMAIALDEDGEYEAAIAVCRTAMEHDMDDGTKTGFAGRIRRIQKKAGDTE
jgi:hypothetical protein